jgi:hypothetical protein
VNRFLVACLLTAATASLGWAQGSPPVPSTSTSSRETRYFELRTYYAAPGKFEALNARFRDHAVRLFEKHGMTSVGYWSPIGNPENKLVFLLAYPDRAARDAAWRSLAEDPEWRRVRKETERNGKLVKWIEEAFLVPTEYSPAVAASSHPPDRSRTFELRKVTVPNGELATLNAQLRDGGVGELRAQGFTPVGFFTLANGQVGTETTLISLMARTPQATARKGTAGSTLLVSYEVSNAASAATIVASEGKLREILKPTDYSPLK